MKTPDDTAIHASLADATFRAYRESVIRLPPDVLRVIKRAAAAETNPLARGEFANILKNIEKMGFFPRITAFYGIPLTPYGFSCSKRSYLRTARSTPKKQCSFRCPLLNPMARSFPPPDNVH